MYMEQILGQSTEKVTDCAKPGPISWDELRQPFVNGSVLIDSDEVWEMGSELKYTLREGVDYQLEGITLRLGWSWKTHGGS